MPPEIDLTPLESTDEISSSVPVDRKSKKELNEGYATKRIKLRELTHLHWAFVALIWVITIAIAAIIICVVTDCLLPVNSQWLTADQLNDIYKIFTNTAIGGLLVGYFSRKLKSAQED